MQRFYYSESIAEFLARPAESILGCMDQVNEFDLTMDQRGAWLEEYEIMKHVLSELKEDGQILFEYTIPRLGKRVDVVLLMKGVVFAIGGCVAQCGEDVSSAMRLSDELMYKDKQAYYETHPRR